MSKVRLEDGRVINFEGTPTEQDIEEVVSQISQPQEAEGLMPSIGERFRQNLPTISGVEEAIRGPIAEAAPAFGQFAGGLTLGALAGRPGAGIRPRGILAREMSRLPFAKRMVPLMGAGDVAGAVGGVLGRTAGQEFKMQAQEAPLETVGREIVTPIGSAMGLPTAPLGAMLPPKVIEPEKRIEALKDIGVTAAVEASVLGGLRGLGAIGKRIAATGAAKKIPDLIRGLGGIYRQTVKEAKRMGFGKVEAIAKDMFEKGADYFTRVITPRVQTASRALFKEGGEGADEILRMSGVSKESVNTFKRSGIDAIKRNFNDFGENTGLIAKRVNATLKENLKRVGNLFDESFNASKGKSINIKNTFFRLQNNLKQYGLIDAKGNALAQETGSTTLNTLVRVYGDMKRFVVGESADFFASPTGEVGKELIFDKAGYNNILLRLKAATSNIPEVDRFVYDVLSSIRKDAAKSIKGLGPAMKKYAVAATGRDLAEKHVRESVLNRKTIDLATRKILATIDDSLPQNIKFYKKLMDSRAGKEVLKVVDSLDNPEKIEALLRSFGKFRKPDQARLGAIKKILSFLPDKGLADDTLGYFLVEDVFQEILPAGFGGAAGISRSVFEAATRKMIAGTAPPTLRKAITKRALGRAVPVGITQGKTRE